MSENSEDHNSGIDPKLLELLVCPLTKTRLRFDRENSELISEVAKLAYPVRGGVPILLPSEARRLDGLDIPADSNSD